MKYIFEDHKDSKESKLFRAGYPKSVSDNFIYTNGHGNLYAEAKKQLELDSEIIVVFIDMPPDNPEIVHSYNHLCTLARNEDRLAVIPIVCSEYYIASMVFRYYPELVINNEILQACLDVSYWGELPLNEQDKRFCRNFENFCKVAVKKSFISCVASTDTFYTRDCLCDTFLSMCKSENIRTKSMNLLKSYPAVPSGSFFTSDKTRISIAELAILCNNLCKDHNDKLKLLMSQDSTIRGRMIKPFKVV